MIKLELSEQEAESFKAWRQYQDTFETLLNAGVFAVRNGMVRLTFNQDGVLISVWREGEEWRRKRQKGSVDNSPI